MPIQISTEGSGPSVDTVTVGSTRHRQVVALGSLSSTEAGSTAVTIGSAALLAGSSGNTIGNVTVSNSVAVSSGIVLGAGSTANALGSIALLGGTTANTLGNVTVSNNIGISSGSIGPSSQWTVSVSSGVILGAGSTANALGSIALLGGTTANSLGSVALLGGTTANSLGSMALLAGTTATVGGVQLAPGTTATTLGSVALLPGSTANTIGSVGGLVGSTGGLLITIGWATEDLHLPVALTTSAFSTAIIDPRSLIAGSSANIIGSVTLSAGTTGTVGGVQLAPGTTATTLGSISILAGSTGNTIGTVSYSSLMIAGVVGFTTHDAVDADASIKIGGIARTANPTKVSALDRTDAAFDTMGRQVVVVGQVRELYGSTGVTVTSTAEASFVSAGGANVYRDITDLVITNKSTGTVITCDIASSSGGASMFQIVLAERGGAVMNFVRPIKQATANSNWTVKISAPSTVYFLTNFENNTT